MKYKYAHQVALEIAKLYITSDLKSYCENDNVSESITNDFIQIYKDVIAKLYEQ